MLTFGPAEVIDDIGDWDPTDGLRVSAVGEDRKRKSTKSVVPDPEAVALADVACANIIDHVGRNGPGIAADDALGVVFEVF